MSLPVTQKLIGAYDDWARCVGHFVLDACLRVALQPSCARMVSIRKDTNGDSENVESKGAFR
jgi:hypothetical protein